MSLIKQIFGKTPFGPLVEHARKVHACVELVRPITEAMIREDYEEVHRLQDEISRREYEADLVKHEIREQLPRRYFLPVPREDIEGFLHHQDQIADRAEDYAVILILRNTKILPEIADELLAFVDQVVKIGRDLTIAAEEIQNLAEASFGGAEADTVLERIHNLGQEEWQADRAQRRLSQHIYTLEEKLDPVTLMFYEKMLKTLGSIANAAENTGELLRQMIVRG